MQRSRPKSMKKYGVQTRKRKLKPYELDQDGYSVDSQTPNNPGEMDANDFRSPKRELPITYFSVGNLNTSGIAYQNNDRLRTTYDRAVDLTAKSGLLRREDAVRHDTDCEETGGTLTYDPRAALSLPRQRVRAFGSRATTPLAKLLPSENNGKPDAMGDHYLFNKRQTIFPTALELIEGSTQ